MIQCQCKHLRCKEMFHSPDMKFDDPMHSGIFWCNQTTRGVGPDGGFVDGEECASTRGCFEE